MDLLLGICLGGIGAALVWQLYPGFWKDPPVAAQEVALQHRQALQDEAQRQAARAALAASAQPAAAPAPCDLQPLIPPGSAHDGRFSVEHPFPGGPRARGKVFLRQARTAAAQGRWRDAEVALLAACRENDKASAKATVPLARVLGMLGERYAAAAGAEASPVLREQLMARARHVLALSARTYATALGPNASRSRQARQRLAKLEQGLVIAADVPPKAGTRPDDELARARAGRAPGVPPASPPKPASMPDDRADPLPVKPRVQPAPAQDRASPQSDPELRQLANDLARLRAQAEAVSDDPAGFRQRGEAAQAQRDRCPDAACLRAWYGRRRRELFAEF